MKILLISDTGFGEGGGTGKYASIIARALEEMNINVVKLGDISNGLDRYFGIGKGLLKIFTNLTKLYKDALNRLLRDYNIDLIHANILGPSNALIVSIMSRKFSLPLITTVHTYVYVCPTEMYIQLPELKPCSTWKTYIHPHCIKCIVSKHKSSMAPYTSIIASSLARTFTMYEYHELLRNSNCIISPSKRFAFILGSLGFGDKVIHMMNPVPIPNLMRVESECEKDILFIGRLEFIKGVHILIQLAKILNNYTIHIIGRGSLEKLIREYAAKYNNLIYHGFVRGDEKFKLISKVGVVIVPSICYEMFSYAVVEAFTQAKPVVAFSLGGPKEIIEASGGGMLAEPFNIIDFANKVEYLLENPSVASKMGMCGRRWVEENLDPRQYAMKLVRIYKQVQEKNIKTLRY